VPGHRPMPSANQSGRPNKPPGRSSMLENRRWFRQETLQRCTPQRATEDVFAHANPAHVADATGSRSYSSPDNGHYVLVSSGSGKSHCAQAIGRAVIQQGYRVLYREAHILLEELADATLDGNRKQHVELLTTVPLLITDDLGMRKLPLTAAEELLEIIMRRYERASTLITSNRPVEDWGKLLGDSAAVSAMLDRLLHHGHVLKCGPRSWRTKTGGPGESQ
jgi:DNA replication protein DnaC